MTKALQSRIFVCMHNLDCFQIGQPAEYVRGQTDSLSISRVERSEECISLTAEICEAIRGVYNMTCSGTGAEIAPWPKFWILVFNQDVLRPMCEAVAQLRLWRPEARH